MSFGIDDDLVDEGRALTREEMDRVLAELESLYAAHPEITHATVEFPWEPFDPLDPKTWTR